MKLIAHFFHHRQEIHLVTRNSMNQPACSKARKYGVILYVLLTSEQPRTIIIDEPHSFLHPGAARKIIEILKDYRDKHQYVIATHAPTIISAAAPETILLLRQEGPETLVSNLDPKNVAEMRDYMAEIGVRLSDVFGADNVLWVEGSMEEQCFPRILRTILGKSLMGTVIRGVKNTGDFAGKHAELVIDLYNRITRASTLVPLAIGFIFDDEGRTETQKSELNHRSGDKTKFLQRRMYENYLLDPEAIAAIMNGISGFRSTPITSKEIADWLNTKGRDPKYGQPRQGIAADPWVNYVDAAKILKDLFNDLSEARVDYKKVVHSVTLTDWILHNKPDQLKEVADVVAGSLKL